VPLEFPHDEGPHRSAIHEWWYLNCHVSDESGNTFGLMVCFFNTGRLYVGITDEKNHVHHRRIVHGKLRATDGKLDISIGENWWVETGKFSYEIHIEGPGICLDLKMNAEKPPLLVGGRGKVSFGEVGDSYYYSQTRLSVIGRMTVHAIDREITGIGWIDRQWGDWDFDKLAGWEWLSVQLDCGIDLLVSELFCSTSDDSPIRHVGLMDVDGRQECGQAFRVGRVPEEPLSAADDGKPQEWMVTIPEKEVDLKIAPTIDGQVLHQGLWEGSCIVEGRVGKEPVYGRAYAEVLRNNRESRAAQLVKRMCAMSRVAEWLDKVYLVLASAVVLLLFTPAPIGNLWAISVLVIFTTFVSSYGYILNAFTDRKQDQIAGKHRELELVPNSTFMKAIILSAFGSLAVPLSTLHWRSAAIGASIFLLATAYSVKPLRLKERGAAGIVVSALAQRPLPFLFFASLIDSFTPLTWFVFAWLTNLGFSVMVAHQLLDYRNDNRAAVESWAQRLGAVTTRRIAAGLLAMTLLSLLLPIWLLGLGAGLAIAAILLVFSAEATHYCFRALTRARALGPRAHDSVGF
jgi:predicted secreted hydrolase/4-hydroxybenzoate polyprenyltransferase